MSTANIARIASILGLALLLTGCAPITSTRGLISLAVAFIAVAASLWGITHGKAEERVCQKANALDRKVTQHVEKYHQRKAGDAVVAAMPERVETPDQTNARAGNRV